MKEELKKQGLASILLMWLPLIPVFWFVAKPLITDALAEDLASSVEQQISPVKGAFVTLLDREIRELKLQVAKFEFRRDNTMDWTDLDAQELANLKIALSEAEEARLELKGEL